MLTTLYTLTPWISWTLFAVVCLGAALRGGLEERTAAAALLVSLVMSVGFRDLTWSGVQWGSLSGDMLLLGVLVTIALRSIRFWPIWASGFQLLNLLTHVARTIDPKVDAWAYASAQVLWTWFMTIAIGFGVRAAWRDRRIADAAATSSL